MLSTTTPLSLGWAGNLSLATLFALASTVISADSSDKRGLVFIPHDDYPEDNQLWIGPGSTMTWYYNYAMKPADPFSSVSQESFEFVPMFWGPPGDDVEDTVFYDTVADLINNEGRNITHVLGFNEPDAPSDWGGSNMEAKDAAEYWVKNMEPLKEDFPWVKIGLPGCTAVEGWVDWLADFLGECAELEYEGRDRNCSFDFLPLHWYDNFEGLANYVGTAREFFPDTPLWITEYAYAHQDLKPTQYFYNQSQEYFDRLDFVERYSYFGSFRSEDSNVGKNAAFLNNDGNLTDIGSWYMGGAATGIDPQSGAVGRTSMDGGRWTLLGCLGVALMVVGL
ncbi:Alkali-sensitive linkage protein 1-like protein 3 [Zalerion maritima]|uniref:Alkali-sensitive linkage protein 1-like protein 3 n=1 Tax=Zalerion maritima TaxID=339359 RepID=A0AAD5RG85_9PEZI|nr:Alkali-sensitive linkage protein 1-like protein 3 [Zalerion maritima]